MTHAAESTHWYTREGEPMYQVPYADPSKGMRDTTLRDAKKLDLVPSVTTILGVANKPGLNRWKEQQILLSALTLPKIDGETLDEFAARVQEDSKKQAQEAAERGTRVHKSLETWFQGGECYPEHLEICKAVEQALVDKYGNRNWIAEKSFAHEFGYGGKIDLLCSDKQNVVVEGLTLDQSDEFISAKEEITIVDEIVLDFKTKEFDETCLPKAYPEQGMQLAAYANGVGYPLARLANVFVSVTNPGLVHIVEHKNDGNLFNQFYHLLRYWQLSKNYDSSWEEE